MALLLLVAVIGPIVAAVIYNLRKLKRRASLQVSTLTPLAVESGDVVSDIIFNGTVL